MERSILNVDLKKYARQIQYPVIDFKIEFLVKIVKNCNCNFEL